MSNFTKWLATFVEEKGIDTEQVLTVPGPSGDNHIPVACLIEAINAATANEQAGIKNMIVRIDFANADVMGYFQHLARAIAV